MGDAREDTCRLRSGAWVVLFAILTACSGSTAKGGGGGAAGDGTGASGGGGGTGQGGGAGDQGGGGAGDQGEGGSGGTGTGGAPVDAGTDGTGTGGAPVDAGTDGAIDSVPRSGSPCGSDADCRGGPMGFLLCQAPGQSLGCPVCQTAKDSCATDADCVSDAGATGGMKVICELVPSTYCFCQPAKQCQPGCRTNDDCGAGQACNIEHQCQATCDPGGAACPVDFSCSSDSFCYRIVCTTDAQCSAACVKGVCYDRPGTCSEPPA